MKQNHEHAEQFGSSKNRQPAKRGKNQLCLLTLHLASAFSKRELAREFAETFVSSLESLPSENSDKKASLDYFYKMFGSSKVSSEKEDKRAKSTVIKNFSFFLSSSLANYLASGRRILGRNLFFALNFQIGLFWTIRFNTDLEKVANVYAAIFPQSLNRIIEKYNQQEELHRQDLKESGYIKSKKIYDQSLNEYIKLNGEFNQKRADLLSDLFKIKIELASADKSKSISATSVTIVDPPVVSGLLVNSFSAASQDLDAMEFFSLLEKMTKLKEKGVLSTDQANTLRKKLSDVKSELENTETKRALGRAMFSVNEKNYSETYNRSLTPFNKSEFAIRKVMPMENIDSLSENRFDEIELRWIANALFLAFIVAVLSIGVCIGFDLTKMDS